MTGQRAYGEWSDEGLIATLMVRASSASIAWAWSLARRANIRSSRTGVQEARLIGSAAVRRHYPEPAQNDADYHSRSDPHENHGRRQPLLPG